MGLFNQIPKSFIELIDSNRDKQYKANIDYKKSINEQELQRGTRVILSLIYRDYLCSEEEKQTLIQKDKEELKKIEEELREKYNPDNLFKNRKNTEEMEQNVALVEYKEPSFIRKILDSIKRFFGIIKE
jgi:DNA helicase HerA-like ATPase